jgi:hypothetical protein
MAYKNCLSFTLVACLVISPSLVSQTVTATTGAINGIVTDSSGAVLANVEITLSGPAEMGIPRTQSSPTGSYQFPAVPTGDYVLTFELAGFGKVTQSGVHVSVGFTATVNVEMKPGAVSENITVESAAPVVDTTSANIATHFESEKLSDLPGSRDVWGLLAQTPAIAMAKMDVGGSNALNQQSYTAYGLNSTTGVNRNDVEGIRVGAANGANDNYYADYGSFTEIAVNSVANSAVMSNPGTYQQYVSKSGGNQFHGDVYFDFENDAMEAHNIDHAQLAAGVAGSATLPAVETNRLKKFQDFNVDQGGYIIKDKLWYYGAYRYTKAGQAYPWLTDIPAYLDAPVETGKLTYNISSRHRISGYYQHENVNQPQYFSAGSSQPIETSDALPGAYFPVTVWSASYSGTLTNTLYVEGHVGAYLSGFREYSKSTAPRISDTGANTVSGGNVNSGLTRNRPQGNWALSYYKSGWGVSHTVRVGGEIMVDHLIAPFDGYGNSCDCISTLNNGTPTQVQLYLGKNVSKNDLWTYGFYVDDTWHVVPRLTVSLGVRLDRYQPELPGQTGPAGQTFSANDNIVTFNNWGTRIGASLALTRDRKTVLKAHFGQFFLYPGVNFTSAFNPNPSGWSQTFKWTDTNHNGYWDPGEQGSLISSSGGTTSTQLASNIKNTYVLQGTTYLERELGSNFGIRTGFVWNGRRQLYGTVNINRPLSAYNVPVSIIDPGPDGKLGTADDGQAFTAYNLSTAALALPVLNLTENIPGSNSNYYTWEVTATRRQTGRWSLLASFAETWSDETNFGNVYFSNLSASYNANALINTSSGYNNYKNWQVKVSSTVDLPFGIRLVPVLRNQSGTPFGRTFTYAFNYGSTPILAEPFNKERTPDITIADLRAEKRFRFKEPYLATGFFDVYNIFNTNAVQTLTTSSGASWLRPTAITGPRIVRLGFKFSF